MLVGLVSCCRKKMASPARARFLYLESSFWVAKRHAEKNCDAWAILSGKHGVVDPDTILNPYDFDLGKQSNKYIEEWAAGVDTELRRRFPNATFLMMASGPYLKAVQYLPHEIKEVK